MADSRQPYPRPRSGDQSYRKLITIYPPLGWYMCYFKFIMGVVMDISVSSLLSPCGVVRLQP